MGKDSSFHDYVVYDLLSDFQGVSSKAMFGGYGVYMDGAIFAIIADGELYFKSNEKTEGFFAARGSRPFTYKKKNNKIYTMNYWFVPSEVYEDRDALAEWVDLALVKPKT